ncbi:MAG: ATP-binding cassette domain-containing protein, partial [Selenomonadaceae bacterium]
MIEIADLTVRYRSDNDIYTAIKDFSLTIPSGGTCAVIGPSGCGKSTLLKVVAGLIKEYDGSVSINGQPVDPKGQTIG